MVFRFPLIKVCSVIGILCFMIAFVSMLLNRTSNVSLINEPRSCTIIIDAGHGGSDGGAVGIDGVCESTINLQISLKTELLCKMLGISTVMTRVSESIDYPSDDMSIAEKKIADQKQRLGLIYSNPGGILFSIHQNTFPSEAVSGIQVLYGHDEPSRILGEILQRELNRISVTGASRTAAEISNDIYLMRECNCTAVLVECGFISNPTECVTLQTEQYQKQIVLAIVSGYMQYLSK